MNSIHRLKLTRRHYGFSGFNVSPAAAQVNGVVRAQNMRPLAVVMLMGFFGSLFGCSKGDGDKPKRYVGESALHENLKKHKTMSPQTIAQLRKHGVTDQSNLKLEFFFYTDKDAKGQALAKALRDLEYKVDCGTAAGDSRLVLVTGWTIPLKMSEDSVVAWTEKMCRLGYEHDCEFDGWGTNPSQ